MSNTIVRTNVLSLNAHRNLGMVGGQQARASQRLSSGFRINSAADDAAGLGISEKMRAQIRGLDQASRNAQDGISLIQTAEGALDTVNEILIRVRELVVQAANDTNVGGAGAQSDRLRIQDEIDQLMNEIDAIATRTEFNTRTLLDGQLSNNGVIRGGEWVAVDVLRTNAPARITTIDQFLRTTSSPAFEGSFGDLLRVIGADLNGTEVQEWMGMVAAGQLSGLAYAIDSAMGVHVGAGTTAAMGGLWNNLPLTAGLTFNNATEMLDAFVLGSTATETTWAAFATSAANQNLTASTFSRMQSSAGGETIYHALRNSGFAGLTSTSTFTEVRNVFYRLGGLQGAAAGIGWSEGAAAGGVSAVHADGIATALQSWLGTRFSEVFDSTATDYLSMRAAETTAARAERAFVDAEAAYRLAVRNQSGTTAINDAREARDTARAAFVTAQTNFVELRASVSADSLETRWNHFVREYLSADTELVEIERWRPNEAERERGNALWFQIGANSGQGISVEIGSMSTGTLFGREGANHTTDRRIINVMDVFGENVQAGIAGGSNFGAIIGGNRVETTLEALDAALAITTRQRSELGAVQNRLEFTIENLDVASENLSAANSRIRDADMAREMMQLTQANVLQQAAISMLAQANQAPQSVLQLLG